MNSLVNQIMVQTMFIEELVKEVEFLASCLEDVLPRLYESEAEASESDEAVMAECALELVAWVQGGERPSWMKAN